MCISKQIHLTLNVQAFWGCGMTWDTSVTHASCSASSI